MARRERRALARRTIARFAARATQGRTPARVDRGEKLSTGRVQGEGRLDDGARISRRSPRLQGRGAQQIARSRRRRGSPSVAGAIPPAPAPAEARELRWSRDRAKAALPSAE